VNVVDKKLRESRQKIDSRSESTTYDGKPPAHRREGTCAFDPSAAELTQTRSASEGNGSVVFSGDPFILPVAAAGKRLLARELQESKEHQENTQSSITTKVPSIPW
jgi:hypothetical protein